MAYEKKEGSGVLFHARQKKSDKSPDMTGDILINGKTYWLSGWWKKGPNAEFLSVAIGDEKQERQEGQPQPRQNVQRATKAVHKAADEAAPVEDDEVPF